MPAPQQVVNGEGQRIGETLRSIILEFRFCHRRVGKFSQSRASFPFLCDAGPEPVLLQPATRLRCYDSVKQGIKRVDNPQNNRRYNWNNRHAETIRAQKI